jgi:hypothetical protein
MEFGVKRRGIGGERGEINDMFLGTAQLFFDDRV